MVIAVNARLLLNGKLEGIGWFTFETLKRLTTGHPEHQFIFIFDRPYCRDFIFSDNIIPVVAGPQTRHPLLWYLWFEFQIPKILKKYNADIFLSPDGYLSLNTNVPQLAVIHDINFVHRPGDLPWLKSRYYNWFFPGFARKAGRIATVSEYSKQDIIKSFNISKEKIDVVYDGVNKIFKPFTEEEQLAVRNQIAGGKRYFLFVGALNPRKNIYGLLRAFNEFKKLSGSDIKLVIVGGEMHKADKIFRFCEQMDYKEDVVFTGRVATVQLQQIMGAALSLVFVPFFEGFGIPVVEAMSAGVPVICSNTTSLPEVGGDAVLYVDPFNIEQIAYALSRMADEPELRRTMIKKGFEQKKKFSWDKTSRLLWSSLERALK
jgi:glycosyltransferase involved in cell wall biosynthesis